MSHPMWWTATCVLNLLGAVLSCIAGRSWWAAGNGFIVGCSLILAARDWEKYDVERTMTRAKERQ